MTNNIPDRVAGGGAAVCNCTNCEKSRASGAPYCPHWTGNRSHNAFIEKQPATPAAADYYDEVSNVLAWLEQRRGTVMYDRTAALIRALSQQPTTPKPVVQVGTIGHVDHHKTTLTAALIKLGQMQQPATPAKGGEAMAVVDRKGNLLGALCWTDAGAHADLPDGTQLYVELPATPAKGGEPSTDWPAVEDVGGVEFVPRTVAEKRILDAMQFVKAQSATPAGGGDLPELPPSNRYSLGKHYYNASQMRAYGQQCRLASTTPEQ
jgi:GTPases - translation elongation factors